MLSRTQHPDLLKMIAETGQIWMSIFNSTYSRQRKEQEIIKLKCSILHKEHLTVKTLTMRRFKRVYEDSDSSTIIFGDRGNVIFQKEYCKCLENMTLQDMLSIHLSTINWQRNYIMKNLWKFMKKNRRVLKKLADDYKCQFWDMGDLLEEGDFVSMVTINDAVCQSGRDKILAYIDRNEEMEDGAEKLILRGR